MPRNIIEEFPDTFLKWMLEWSQKRQAAQVSVKADQRPFLLTKERNNQALGSQALQSGILKLATEQSLPAAIGAHPTQDGCAPGLAEQGCYGSGEATADDGGDFDA